MCIAAPSARAMQYEAAVFGFSFNLWNNHELRANYYSYVKNTKSAVVRVYVC